MARRDPRDQLVHNEVGSINRGEAIYMRVAYFEAIGGAAGDMVVGSLLDAGLELSELEAELQKLPLRGYRLRCERVFKQQVAATQFLVEVEAEDHHHHDGYSDELGADQSRSLAEIDELILASHLPESVKTTAGRIFTRLGEAEGKVRGLPLDEVRFHEAEAIDSVVDVVGAAIGFHLLGLERIYCSPLPMGSGTIQTRHGILQIPAPTTLELMAMAQAPIARGVGIEQVTPTGAAILTTLATFERPPLRLQRVGYGSGESDLEIPNVLRVMIGEVGAATAEEPSVLETRVGGMNPQPYRREVEQRESHPPIVAIVGPTAVGKSGLALEVASEYSAEIVSADSRQIYRYMDIGTAKPAREEQACVPHHMIDLVQPDEVYSAQRYREEGLKALRRIAAKGRVAMVVGGTGFYTRALLDGLFLPPAPPDPELRARLRAEAERLGSAALHERLRRLDPASAERIHPHNLPRVIRALEVVEHLGGAVPQGDASQPLPVLYLGLSMDRDRLREVANRRALAQVKAGLVEETRLLLEMGYSPDSVALQGFAYRQMIDYLQGRSTLFQAIAHYQAATHRYIRRQMTWFRADKRIQWIDASSDAASQARQLILQWLASGAGI